jgi:glycerol-3-phosphate dehydrogenase (NAD(P)+)
MSKIVIIGAGAMGSAFALPCLDNNHDINIVGTHLENEFIDNLKNNNNLHPGLNTQIPQEIKIFKFEKFDELLKSNVDLIVLGISSKGIEWVSDQLSKLYKDNKIPKLLMLTKGLSIYNNEYELLIDKLVRLLADREISNVDISAVGGPCLIC